MFEKQKKVHRRTCSPTLYGAIASIQTIYTFPIIHSIYSIPLFLTSFYCIFSIVLSLQFCIFFWWCVHRFIPCYNIECYGLAIGGSHKLLYNIRLAYKRYIILRILATMDVDGIRISENISRVWGTVSNVLEIEFRETKGTTITINTAASTGKIVFPCKIGGIVGYMASQNSTNIHQHIPQFAFHIPHSMFVHASFCIETVNLCNSYFKKPFYCFNTRHRHFHRYYGH